MVDARFSPRSGNFAIPSVWYSQTKTVGDLEPVSPESQAVSAGPLLLMCFGLFVSRLINLAHFGVPSARRYSWEARFLCVPRCSDESA
jgi:hypothetical protein